jgi:hypothetical protein
MHIVHYNGLSTGLAPGHLSRALCLGSPSLVDIVWIRYTLRRSSIGRGVCRRFLWMKVRDGHLTSFLERAFAE